MILAEAETDRPLYFVRIANEAVERRLIAAEFDIEKPVWKRYGGEGGRAVWVQWGKGEAILSAGMSMDLVVHFQRDQQGEWCSLDQAPVGAVARLVEGQSETSKYAAFWDKCTFIPTCHFRIHRKIPRFVFQVEIGGHVLEINDESAFHLWIRKGGYWVQLGALPIGQAVRVQAWTGHYSLEHGLRRVMENDTIVTLKRIIVEEKKHIEPVTVIDNHYGSQLSLSKGEAEQIDVRLCDICWSCGLCRKQVVQS